MILCRSPSYTKTVCCSFRCHSLQESVSRYSRHPCRCCAHGHGHRPWRIAKIPDGISIMAFRKSGIGEAKRHGLTGAEALDCAEIAALPGKVTTREITVRPVAPEESLAAMEELAALAPKGYFAGIETTV